jgi:hypothetical protein
MTTKKIVNLINKYAKYRGELDKRLSADLLLEVYLAASPEDRRKYVKEMNVYIKAVDEGKISKGVPLEVLELSS